MKIEKQNYNYVVSISIQFGKLCWVVYNCERVRAVRTDIESIVREAHMKVVTMYSTFRHHRVLQIFTYVLSILRSL